MKQALPLASAEVHFGVDALNNAYAQCLDDKRIDQWPSFFAEKCVYRIYPRENLENGLPANILFFDSHEMMLDRVLCVRDVNVYAAHSARHFLGRSSVRLRSDGEYEARTSLMVVHCDIEGRSEIFAVGEYQDVIVETGGLLQFREKVIILDSFTVTSHMAEPL